MAKDWNGNGNSIFKTLGASNHTEKERETDDFYATDPAGLSRPCGDWEADHRIINEHEFHELNELFFEHELSRIIHELKKEIMEDEVAKCVAEGIADRMLNALEKKVKSKIGDASEYKMPAGLGKLYFCRVEDLRDNPDAQPIPLGEAVSIKPGMLTHKDDGDARPDYSAKGFSATFTGTMEEPSDELMALLKKPLKCDVKLQRQLGCMPRKMKKAHRSDYPRNTKWKRKVANYLRRMTIYLRNGELVVTEEQFNRLSATICGSKVQ